MRGHNTSLVFMEKGGKVENNHLSIPFTPSYLEHCLKCEQHQSKLSIFSSPEP